MREERRGDYNIHYTSARTQARKKAQRALIQQAQRAKTHFGAVERRLLRQFDWTVL